MARQLSPSPSSSSDPVSSSTPGRMRRSTLPNGSSRSAARRSPLSRLSASARAVEELRRLGARFLQLPGSRFSPSRSDSCGAGSPRSPPLTGPRLSTRFERSCSIPLFSRSVLRGPPSGEKVCSSRLFSRRPRSTPPSRSPRVEATARSGSRRSVPATRRERSPATSVTLLSPRLGRRSILAIAAVVAALAGAAIFSAPLRQRIAEAAGMVRAGEWDRLTTYRTGAWAAALDMARERPLVGWGPGTYAAEFVPHRLQAEIRAKRRYVNPLLTSSYSEAHCDYLQAFAETGVPGGLAAIVALAALVGALARRAAGPPGLTSERAVLLGILAAGAAAALTWFPMQRPISAVPLLLAAGRSWRIAAANRKGPPLP